MVWTHSQYFGSSSPSTSGGRLFFIMASSSSGAPAMGPTASPATLLAKGKEAVPTPQRSEPTAGACSALVPSPGRVSALVPEIARLKAERQALRDQRKKLAKDLKNAERKRSRLKKRAKLLSDSDLVAVMMLRVAERKDITLSAEEEHPEKMKQKRVKQWPKPSPTRARPHVLRRLTIEWRKKRNEKTATEMSRASCT